MKYSKKIILLSSLILMIFPLFLIPRTAVAQEWTYDGVNTEKIPEFSVYPSEWYVYNNSVDGVAVEHLIIEVAKANISDTFMGMTSSPPYYGTFTNGTSIYASMAWWNTTTDEKVWYVENDQYIYWNGTAYLSGGVMIIPIDESTGKVTEGIMEKVLYSMGWLFNMMGDEFEHNATYPNRYSFRFWNTTANNAYMNANYTESGFLNKAESYLVTGPPNMTLYSKPAQNPPAFDFTTETGSLTFNSTDFKLSITITDADNNNDGEIDTDYLYRIQNGTTWTDWATPPDLLDWDLGDVETGNYTITMETKNMYGVTQKEVTIEYVPPKKPGSKIIPGYNLLLIALFTMITSAIIVRKRRKKL